jgi:hypothetical protein
MQEVEGQTKRRSPDRWDPRNNTLKWKQDEGLWAGAQASSLRVPPATPLWHRQYLVWTFWLQAS